MYSDCHEEIDSFDLNDGSSEGMLENFGGIGKLRLGRVMVGGV